jgi:hypothetical protein
MHAVIEAGFILYFSIVGGFATILAVRTELGI